MNRLRWLIKNPAPKDSRLVKWGDYHFGRSLTKYLLRSEQEVITEYHHDWDSQTVSDIVLVLRGKYPFQRTEANAAAFHVMWNISHPGSVTLEEYNTYDLVLVASDAWANDLRRRIDPPVYPLLQCTDTEEFYPQPSGQAHRRQGFIFVGNTREERRRSVIWGVEYGLPLQIWGRGWEHWIDPDHVVADYIDNQILGHLYSRARLTFNDHWDDMQNYGFINNRVFDALACELPIISDYHPALAKLFPEEVLFFKDRASFEGCVQKCLLAYPLVEEAARHAREMIEQKFSFKQRAASLMQWVDQIRASQSTHRSRTEQQTPGS